MWGRWGSEKGESDVGKTRFLAFHCALSARPWKLNVGMRDGAGEPRGPDKEWLCVKPRELSSLANFISSTKSKISFPA